MTDRRKYALIALGVIAGIFILFFDGTREAESAFERELREIAPLPGAEKVSDTSLVKPSRVFLAVTYRSGAPYQLVRDHYTQELLARGWALEGEGAPTDRTQEATRIARYRRDHYRAELVYRGPVEGGPANSFSLNLTWDEGSP